MDIFDASIKGDLERIKQLVIEGVDINSKTKNGITPLIFAVNNGHFEIVQYLVENGADISIKDSGGYDAIMEANLRFDLDMSLYLSNQLKYRHRKKIINKLFIIKNE